MKSHALSGFQTVTTQLERDQAFFALASECTVEAWLGVLGHRWNALTLYHLSCGDKRFGDLLEQMPTLRAKVLAERLGDLVRRGLVERGQDATPVRYALTRAGRELMPVLHALEAWARAVPVSGPTLPSF